MPATKTKSPARAPAAPNGNGGSPFQLLDLRVIASAKRQPRTDVQEGLKDLADSIRRHGVLQPIVVRERTKGRYELIAGWRRLSASRLAKRKDIPVIVRKSGDDRAFIEALVENVQRRDLPALDIARSIRLMREADPKLTEKTIARDLGVKQPWVSNKLRLLDLEPGIVRKVESGALSESHAKALLSLTKSDRQEFAAAAEKQGWSSRDLEREVRTRSKRAADTVKSNEALEERKATVLKQIKRALAAGQKVFAVTVKKGDAFRESYFTDEELPKKVKRMGIAERLPTGYQLQKFAACATCPTTKIRQRDGMPNTKALLVGFKFVTEVACGVPAHYTLLEKNLRKDAADDRRHITDAVENGRKAVHKLLTKDAIVTMTPTSERLLRTALYLIETSGSQYSHALNQNAKALVKRWSGLNEQALASATVADLWPSIGRMPIEDVVSHIGSVAAMTIVTAPGEYAYSYDQHAVARASLFSGAGFKDGGVWKSARKEGQRVDDREKTPGDTSDNDERATERTDVDVAQKDDAADKNDGTRSIDADKIEKTGE